VITAWHDNSWLHIYGAWNFYVFLEKPACLASEKVTVCNVYITFNSLVIGKSPSSGFSLCIRTFCSFYIQWCLFQFSLTASGNNHVWLWRVRCGGQTATWGRGVIKLRQIHASIIYTNSCQTDILWNYANRQNTDKFTGCSVAAIKR